MKDKRINKGWEVEWCPHIPKDEHGDFDFDQAEYYFRDFATHALAMRFALSVADKDQFGAARINQFELRRIEPGYPGVCKEYIGEAEKVEPVPA